MRFKKHVTSISISDKAHDRVLFEGNLGKLLNLSLEEGDVLEFVGVNGILRIDLTREQMKRTLQKKDAIQNLCSKKELVTENKEKK